ncbi:MAG: hypothetical protein KDI56_14160, partial [Xanthomonadales bacterium]|nr:hypothetical protein [Xanthomonadales bacterium]
MIISGFWRQVGAPLLLSTLLLGAPAWAGESIPLTVLEARPAVLGAATTSLQPGRDRQNEPFTVGIPLPAAFAVCSDQQLDLTNASLAQFRTLERRRDGACGGAGSIAWVLVDSQTSLPANGRRSDHALIEG